MYWEPLEPDPNDACRPRPMAEPLMLFRSMALPELIEIMRTGKVVGGGNVFHSSEDRPYVFFGGELNESLLTNGESLDRCAASEIHGHPIRVELEAASQQVRWVARVILRRLRTDRIKFDRFDEFAFRSGSDPLRLIRQVAAPARARRATYGPLLRAYLRALKHHRRLDTAHFALVRERFSELVRRAPNQPITSAVIVTYPVMGGLEYREEFGITGNRGEPEYGFRPGQITSDHIMAVLLVKGGAIVGKIDCERFGEIGAICEAAMAVETVDQASVGWVGPSSEVLRVTCHADGKITWEVEGDVRHFLARVPWLFFPRSGAV